jgi:hypothetical protein
MLKNNKSLKIAVVLLVLMAVAGMSLGSISAATPTYNWKLVKGDKLTCTYVTVNHGNYVDIHPKITIKTKNGIKYYTKRDAYNVFEALACYSLINWPKDGNKKIVFVVGKTKGHFNFHTKYGYYKVHVN